MTHYQLKYLCLFCDTAFIVLTKDIKPYHADGAHCPDCGATGTSLRHDNIADGCIEDVVPGDSPLIHIGEYIEEQHVDGELHAYVLKDHIRRQISKELLLAGLQTLLPPELQSVAEALKRGDI